MHSRTAALALVVVAIGMATTFRAAAAERAARSRARPERRRPAARVRGPDACLRGTLGRRLRRRRARQGAREAVGGRAAARRRPARHREGRAACASCPRRGAVGRADRRPARRWTRAARAGCSTSRSSPSFATDRTLFWSYAEPREGGNATSVARGVLSRRLDARSSDVRVIFRALPTYDGTHALRLAARLRAGRHALRDHGRALRSRHAPARAAARQPHRQDRCASRPTARRRADNPLRRAAGAQPEIWSLGHRNIQAAAFDAAGPATGSSSTARAAATSSTSSRRAGTTAGRVRGLRRSSTRAPDPRAARPIAPAYEQPGLLLGPGDRALGRAVLHRRRASRRGAATSSSARCASRRLVRLVLENGRVAGEEHLLADRGQRIRDVRAGPRRRALRRHRRRPTASCGRSSAALASRTERSRGGCCVASQQETSGAGH